MIREPEWQRPLPPSGPAVEDYAIYMLDPAGCTSSWNTGAERNKGYQASEILGQHFRCFYLPQDAAEGLPEKALLEAKQSGHFAGEGWRVLRTVPASGPQSRSTLCAMTRASWSAMPR